MLMADMFGMGYGGKPKTFEQLAAGMKAVHNDLPFTIACGGAAYNLLLSEADKLGLIDTGRKAAIGFCAGGGFALEQARAGADFKAVVVFHVTNPNPVVAGTPCNIKGRVLAIYGTCRSGDAEADDGCARGRADQGQGRLARRHVRPRRALVLRSHR